MVPNPTADGEPTRPENKHQQRSRISTKAMLDAAAELIAEGGLDAVTLAAVGARSGHSRGLVSARFGSKEGLLEQLVDRMIRGLFARGDAAVEDDRTALEAVGVMVDSLWKQIEEDDLLLRALYTMMFEAARPIPAVRPAIRKLNRDLVDRFAQLFAAGIEEGSIRRDIDPSAEALLLVAELRGVAYLWMLDFDRFDAVASFRFVSAALLDRVGVVDR